MAAAGGLLVVPSGKRLVAYEHAMPLDAGAPDASTAASEKRATR